MRWILIIVAASVLGGCPAPTAHPLKLCDAYEGCAGPYDCVGFRCIGRCSFEGDCDLGFRCSQGQCLQSCEDQDECTIGQCAGLGDDRPGSACMLVDLPTCGTDLDCNFDLCVDGRCEASCEWDEACGEGRLCEFVRADRGSCVDDPDYLPPPPPANCSESPSPDIWCVNRENQPNAFCDFDRARCDFYYSAVLLVDDTEPTLCSDDDDSPGSDLLGVRILNEGSEETFVSTFEFGAGAGNQHLDWTVVETHAQPACSSGAYMSLGCGGGIVFLPGQGPMRSGWSVEVYTERDWCAAEPEDAGLSVYLCPAFPPDVPSARLVCETRLGSTRDGVVLTLP